MRKTIIYTHFPKKQDFFPKKTGFLYKKNTRSCVSRHDPVKMEIRYAEPLETVDGAVLIGEKAKSDGIGQKTWKTTTSFS